MYYFTEDCYIGIEQIDNEHRQLFKIINETMELLKKEAIPDKCTVVTELLKKLYEYADTHFAHEEAYMESIHDPELSLQKKQHEAFRQKIASFSLEQSSKENESQKALENLMLYLTKWLYNHILSSDIMIGKMPAQNEKENVFSFTDKYLTGIPQIDTEHRTLFEIIEEANNLIHAEFLHDKFDEIVKILDRLKNYTIEHFSHEEAYMQSIGYPKLEEQKRAHTAFVDKLCEINLDELDQNQQQSLIDLIDFLLGWLTQHILLSDKQIGNY